MVTQTPFIDESVHEIAGETMREQVPSVDRLCAGCLRCYPTPRCRVFDDMICHAEVEISS